VTEEFDGIVNMNRRVGKVMFERILGNGC